MSLDESKVVKGHCPKCGPDRLADVVGRHRDFWKDDDDHVWLTTHYRILSCRGCTKPYFQEEQIFSEDVDYRFNHRTGEEETFIPSTFKYWPSPLKRKPPDWIERIFTVDESLSSLLDEIYAALNNDMHVLAAIGIRTAFDRASELLGVSANIRFDQKIDRLLTTGKIGIEEKDILAVLTDAGSAAAHRGWRPGVDQIATMISAIEQFLYRNFLLGNEFKKFKNAYPAREKLNK